MPTVILLDVSLSMSRRVSGTAAENGLEEPLTRRHLAVLGINAFLDYLTLNGKMEFVSLVSEL